MEVKPIRKYTEPSYPTLPDIRSNPDLLKALPKRWQHNRAVLAALMSLAMISTAGCTQSEVAEPVSGLQNSSSAAAGTSVTTVASATAAPVFYHGEGTGALGCEMVAPPVFLSEAEALAIIKNEAAAAGIQLDDTPDAYTAKPGTAEDPSDQSRLVTIGSNVSLDSLDKERNIAVSFISMDDSDAKPVVDANSNTVSFSTVTSYYSKKRAEQAVTGWTEENVPYVVGTFYDPGVDSSFVNSHIKNLYSGSGKERNEKQKAYETKAKEQLEKDLRAQVNDFIGWLKGQGVI